MPRVEAVAWYKCLDPRCPVRHWPVEVGDQCPNCDKTGFYAGVVAKIPDAPPEHRGGVDGRPPSDPPLPSM